ncbi:hypothetical protein J7E88_22185 [Streptomyces sp. ISL-10]|nr:hypothetical protein [Streptomyces sp. ISL-10]MBT2367946.1 hypothetical protein [Streptomyces sp. ISL-10]
MGARLELPAFVTVHRCRPRWLPDHDRHAEHALDSKALSAPSPGMTCAV